MSELPFLDNAQKGRNNWWIYTITIVLTFLALFLGTAFISEIFNTITQNPLNSVVVMGVGSLTALIILYLSGRFLHHKTFISFINTGKNIRWSHLLKGALLWFILLVLLSIPLILMNPTSFKFSFNLYPFLALLIVSLLCIPVQSFFEEVFFRGYLMQGFSLVFKRALIPLFLTSIIFGLMHAGSLNLGQSLLSILGLTILGLLWGIVTLADNGIELAAGSHIANNLIMALILNPADPAVSGLPSLVTSSGETYLNVIILGVASVLFIVILFWNRKSDLKIVLSSKKE